MTRLMNRSLCHGFLLWLIPLVAALCISPLRTSNRLLFEAIMPVVLAACGTLFAVRLSRLVSAPNLRQATFTAAAWLLIPIVLDLPLFLLQGPMQMSLAEYMTDIGVTYLIYPIIFLGVCRNATAPAEISTTIVASETAAPSMSLGVR